ncbi:MAG TPA: hypothetical protein VN956_22275 [Pyrinomonadaceae bacterium]|nr:hypothetical protein [Pyrinomonadaceae bacterium]
MSNFILDEVIGKKYLLGELPLEDQHRVEELAFLEPQSFEFLQELENELIDDYISNDLTPREQKRFETYFLSKPGRREDLEIATAFQSYINRHVPAAALSPEEQVHVAQKGSSPQLFSPIPRLPVPVWVALTVLILAAAALMTVRLLKTRNASNPIQANRQTQKTEQPAEQNIEAVTNTPTPASIQTTRDHRLPVQRSAPAVLSFLLIPGAPARGGGNSTKVPLPASGTLLRFELPLIDQTEYASYQVTLQRVEDANEVRMWKGLRSQTGSSGKSIRLSVNSQVLKVRLQYRLVLVGIAPDASPHTVGYYHFVTTD